VVRGDVDRAVGGDHDAFEREGLIARARGRATRCSARRTPASPKIVERAIGL
jgi:hypothetical protein